MSLFIKGRSLLSLEDLQGSEIDDLLDFAHELRGRFHAGEQLAFLKGSQFFVFDPDNVFAAWDPFRLAVDYLGGRTRRIAPEDLNLAWGENYYDLVTVLDRCGHGLGVSSIRPGEGHGFIKDLAGIMHRPVFNLLSEVEAPFQALATLMTVRERLGSNLDGARVALCWAPPGISPKPASLAMSTGEALTRAGASLQIACPDDFLPGEESLAPLQDAAGGLLDLTDEPAQALDAADIVLAMNWNLATTGSELEEEGEMAARHEGWTLTEERLKLASANAVVGGGLPQAQDKEIAESVLHSERSIHVEESENLLHVAMAVFALSLDLQNDIRGRDEPTLQ